MACPERPDSSAVEGAYYQSYGHSLAGLQPPLCRDEKAPLLLGTFLVFFRRVNVRLCVQCGALQHTRREDIQMISAAARTKEVSPARTWYQILVLSRAGHWAQTVYWVEKVEDNRHMDAQEGKTGSILTGRPMSTSK